MEAAQQAKEAAAPKAQSRKGAAKGAAEAAEGAKLIFCPYVEAEAPKAKQEAKRKAGSRKRCMEGKRKEGKASFRGWLSLFHPASQKAPLEAIREAFPSLKSSADQKAAKSRFPIT
jgi:hypothetical protein